MNISFHEVDIQNLPIPLTYRPLQALKTSSWVCTTIAFTKTSANPKSIYSRKIEFTFLARFFLTKKPAATKHVREFRQTTHNYTIAGQKMITRGEYGVARLITQIIWRAQRRRYGKWKQHHKSTTTGAHTPEHNNFAIHHLYRYVYHHFTLSPPPPPPIYASHRIHMHSRPNRAKRTTQSGALYTQYA